MTNEGIITATIYGDWALCILAGIAAAMATQFIWWYLESRKQ